MALGNIKYGGIEEAPVESFGGFSSPGFTKSTKGSGSLVQSPQPEHSKGLLHPAQTVDSGPGVADVGKIAVEKLLFDPAKEAISQSLGLGAGAGAGTGMSMASAAELEAIGSGAAGSTGGLGAGLTAAASTFALPLAAVLAWEYLDKNVLNKGKKPTYELESLTPLFSKNISNGKLSLADTSSLVEKMSDTKLKDKPKAKLQLQKAYIDGMNDVTKEFNVRLQKTLGSIPDDKKELFISKLGDKNFFHGVAGGERQNIFTENYASYDTRPASFRQENFQKDFNGMWSEYRNNLNSKLDEVLEEVK